ncbi:SixA phosphatase family protein [Nocardioides zeicaulis]|uniref:Histidine phosphatase family protein n=1 Tax=Nocardioides zeicaulis TaxID=1776857 RepID=A0ABV6DW32_9ACTN
MQESTTGGHRRLVIVRHAKAEPTGATDHGRDLSDRGRADAEEAGRWLREQGVVPDAALVSDARRTHETWLHLALGAGWDVEPGLSPALYAAGPDAARDLVRETGAGVGTLVVVGHNPTMAYVAELLDDGDGDDDATTDMVVAGFPPASVAVFDVACGWGDLDAGAGRLTGFHVGSA